MTDNDREDLLTDYIAQMEEAACKIVAISKERQSNAEIVVYPDSDGNDKTAEVYDCRIYSWKNKDTFDKLAADYMGSADYGTLIAYYNKIANESEIEAGTTIKIPILSESEENGNNRIYAEPDKWNNYGSDIMLDDEGDIAVSHGDIAEISGGDNLAQAIVNRLTTASSKRIRLGTYGIRSNIGDPIAVESYLISTIEQTIKADPRIREIDEITFKGAGDKLILELSYTDINGNKGDYKGEI